MKIIDAHQHFWKKELFSSSKLPPELDVLVKDYLPQDLKPLMDQMGVSQTVLVQTYSSFQNTLEFIEIANRNDWIGAVVGWVDLADPEINLTLDSLGKFPKIKGVRHQWEDEPDPAWILRPDIVRGLKQVAKHGYSYDLLAKPPNWKYIPMIAEAVPDLPLVIDHIAKPNIRIRQYKEWNETMALAARFPQIMLKLSGMINEADWHQWKPKDLKPYIDRGIELFGTDRVMFGSDWPVCLLAGSYDQVFEAVQECLVGFNEADCEKIFYENARKFYRISGTNIG